MKYVYAFREGNRDQKYLLGGNRAYPCVKAGIIVDSRPAGSNPNGPPVRVYTRALICRSLEEPRVGVFAGFAYQAQQPSADMDAQALAFQQGVVLQPSAKRPWTR